MTEITVYTHSTLGLGQEAAFASHERKLRSDGGTEDPCAPIGLDARHVYGSAGTPELKPLTPRGNFTRCVMRSSACSGWTIRARTNDAA